MLQTYPNLSRTQRIVLKLAASLLAEDEMGWDELESEKDQRITISGDDFDLIPGTIEVLDGLMRPKHWETPNRLARADEEE